MADGIEIGATGLKEAQQFATEMAIHLSDLSKPLRDVAKEIDKRTAQGFAQAQSQFGVPFAPLAETSLEQRIAATPAANKRTKAGVLTKASQRKRAALAAPSGVKPLEGKTNRLAKSCRTVVDTPHSLQFSCAEDLLFHMSGGQHNGKLGHPPQRNPTVFIRIGKGLDFDFLGGGGQKWAVDPSMEVYLVRALEAFILGDKADQTTASTTQAA